MTTLRSIDAILGEFDASLPIGEASTIPGPWYTDPRIGELEKRTVWSHNWLLVARAAQVEAPGQYVTAQVGDEPIVVVRGQDGVLRAFFNVCRHHAAAVMTAPEGCAQRLRCPYHGWTYGLDGQLRSTPEMDDARGFDRAANGLVPVRVAVWEHWVFVCLSDEGPSLEAYLGAMVDQVAPLSLGTLRFAERREDVLSCNWKVFVDNYLDGGYHVPYLHRGLNSVLSFEHYSIETSARSCLQSSHVDAAGGGDPETASVRQGKAFYFWLYPNLMLNWYDGYLDTNLVIPEGTNRTRVIFDFYFADVSPAAKVHNEASIAVCERIQHEDHAICESVQRGLSSRAYGAGRYSPRREAGELLFHRLLASDLRSGAR